MDIPIHVDEIKEMTFRSCENLTTVHIPDGVKRIGTHAFLDCAFTSIKLPEKLAKIDGSAFMGCNNLKSIVIPESVTEIGDWAFGDCMDLEYVTISNSVKKIGYKAFSGTKWDDSWEDGPVYIGNILYTYKGEIPQDTELVVKDGTIYISSGALQWHGGTRFSVVIPGSVTEIGSGAFLYCDGLYSVHFSEGLKVIGSEAFSECQGLTSVTIPNSVEEIGEYAFSGCSALREINNGMQVEKIGTEAFDNTKWYNVQPDGLIYLGHCLYKYKGTMLPNTHIDIADGTLGIATRAFADCNNLKSVTIPTSVKKIGEWAFSGCTGLTSVDLSEGITEINAFTFWGCTSLKSISIPYGVTSIGTSAFGGCSGLTSVVIPNSVKEIGMSAFSAINEMTSLIIPNSVESIDIQAFWGWRNLTDVYCYAESVPIAEDAFLPHEIINTVLHVPAQALEAYQAASAWNNFAKILPLPELEPMQEDMAMTFADNVTEETDLSDVVIDNIYVTIDANQGDMFDVESQCINLTSTVDETILASIAEKNVNEPVVKELFNGLIMEVPAGTGTFNITTQTTGNRILNVKVGNQEVQSFSQPERGTVEIQYETEENAYVYIYGGVLTSDAKSRKIEATSSDADVVKIYGIQWSYTPPASIDSLTANKIEAACQIYTINGLQVNALQKGVNIIKYMSGKVKKVVMK